MLRQIQYQDFEPQKIAALIHLVENDLGYRLRRAIDQTECRLSDCTISEFRFDVAAGAICDHIRREDFENWIALETKPKQRMRRAAAAQNNVDAKDIEAVFMIGGSSFAPTIKRQFKNNFGADFPIRTGWEFTFVAERLAIYASELFGSGKCLSRSH